MSFPILLPSQPLQIYDKNQYDRESNFVDLNNNSRIGAVEKDLHFSSFQLRKLKSVDPVITLNMQNGSSTISHTLATMARESTLSIKKNGVSI